MKKRSKILLGIFIPIIILSSVVGGLYLNQIITKNRILKLDPPLIDFPVANTSVIDVIWGYGYHNDIFHGGIDFVVNDSTDIIASCMLEIAKIEMWLNGDLWQTTLSMKYNDRFYFLIQFESAAQNETYGIFQRDAIIVEEGDLIERGEILGELLCHGPGAHIDFGLKDQDEDSCTYQYFSETAKTTFDLLWSLYGYGDDSWYITPYTGLMPTDIGGIDFGTISIIGSVVLIVVLIKRRKEAI